MVPQFFPNWISRKDTTRFLFLPLTSRRLPTSPHLVCSSSSGFLLAWEMQAKCSKEWWTRFLVTSLSVLSMWMTFWFSPRKSVLMFLTCEKFFSSAGNMGLQSVYLSVSLLFWRLNSLATESLLQVVHLCPSTLMSSRIFQFPPISLLSRDFWVFSTFTKDSWRMLQVFWLR